MQPTNCPARTRVTAPAHFFRHDDAVACAASRRGTPARSHGLAYRTLVAPFRRAFFASLFLLGALHALPAAANTYTASNTNDSGPGSLRQAILDANGHPGADTIWVIIPSGAQTISPATPLPDVTDAVLIDGWVQNGFAGTPLIRIDGNQASTSASPAAVDGLRIYAGPTTVRGLIFTRFSGNGAFVGGGDTITFRGCYFGTTGSATGLGNGGGLRLYSGSNVWLGGTNATDPNVISGNADYGIYVDDTLSGLLLQGNRIGTNAAGSAALGNGSVGVRSFASNVDIGGGTAAERNVFSGNGAGGLTIEGGNSITIQGNYFGLDAGGTVDVGNAGVGVAVYGTNATVGGANVGEGNVSSGNDDDGILIGASNVSVLGNRIGTNAAGTTKIGNGGDGVHVSGNNVTVGGPAAGAGNLIAASGREGVAIDAGVTGAIIKGNWIGLDVGGTLNFGNGGSGVDDYGDGTQIGGTAVGEGNAVAGNAYYGLGLAGSNTVVAGNRVGTNAAGTAAVSNVYGGIYVDGTDIAIGGTTVAARNLISGNGYAGVTIDTDAAGINVYGNFIGTDVTGTVALANDGGVGTAGTNVAIGGAVAGSGNIISGNVNEGIYVASGSGVSIRRNYIGTDVTGLSAVGNGGYAIRADGAPGTLIGTPGNGNVISGNSRGVVLGYSASGYLVRGNIIGLDKTAMTPLGNDEHGIDIETANNVIGGTALGAFNIIASNAAYGIFLQGSGATSNRIENNYLGTNTALAPGLGNWFNIVIFGGHDNWIGGTAAGTGNWIANGTNMGIDNTYGSGNSFLQNSIFGNGGAGIELDPQGLVPNDRLDLDHGANEGQNFPMVTLATAGAGSVSVAGALASGPSQQYRVEYFVSSACQASGFGEGQHFIGFQNVVTDADGNAALAALLSTVYTSGFVTATATGPDGSTSEFSPCVAIGAPGPGEFNIFRNPVLAYEDIPQVQIAVTRSKGFAGAVSMHFKTLDDTATAPSDYTAVDQVLNFADGEALKIVTVPIVLDDVVEGDENFKVELTDITGGGLYGPNATADVLLFDHDVDAPFYLIDDVDVAAPATGTKIVNVPIRLSAPTNHTVTLTWTTDDTGDATAGVDYVATSGSAVFAPGETVKFAPVTIKANAPLPADRVLYVDINGAIGNVIAWDGQAEIVLFGGDRIFANGFQ